TTRAQAAEAAGETEEAAETTRAEAAETVAQSAANTAQTQVAAETTRAESAESAAQAAAAQAETDAQAGMANAATAETAANTAQTQVAAETTRAEEAEASIVAAQSPTGALAANGATSLGSGTANVVTFPGTVAGSVIAPAIKPYVDPTNAVYGMSTSATAAANTAALQAAINAAYNSSAGGNGNSVVIPPGYYYLNPGIDAKDISIDCAGVRTTNFVADYPVTLNLSGAASGVAFTHLGAFNGCKVVGPYAQGGAVTGSISSISESAGTVSVVLSTAPTNPPLQTMGFRIEGTTGYNGTWRVQTVTDAQHFTFRRSALSNAAAENSGTIYYHPTVALQHLSENNGTNSCCDVVWTNFMVQGFGTALDLSSGQTSGGSTDNWRVQRGYINIAQIGVNALGNGAWFDGAQPHANVSLGRLEQVTITRTMTAVNCGPPGSDEEGGCVLNTLSQVDAETADTNVSDGTVVKGIVIGGSKNIVQHGTSGAFVALGAGQTTSGWIDTSGGQGSNSIHDNNVSGSPDANGRLIEALASDSVYDNGGGAAQGNSATMNSISGGLRLISIGTTPAPASVTCSGACGGPAMQYALVCIDRSGGRAAPSALVGSVNAAGAAAGPTSFGGSSGVTIRVAYDPRCAKYDVLIGDTAHYLAASQGTAPGTVSGSNYFTDNVGTGVAGYPTSVYGASASLSDSTGGLLLGSALAPVSCLSGGLQYPCLVYDSGMVAVTNQSSSYGVATFNLLANAPTAAYQVCAELYMTAETSGAGTFQMHVFHNPSSLYNSNGGVTNSIGGGVSLASSTAASLACLPITHVTGGVGSVANISAYINASSGAGTVSYIYRFTLTRDTAN
ncbi:MAG TPA: hypothetical protein VMU71_10855, partial [Terracidiphilus sp.]|nr:hypothetical protein [Terracidiphilus sp.]